MVGGILLGEEGEEKVHCSIVNGWKRLSGAFCILQIKVELHWSQFQVSHYMVLKAWIWWEDCIVYEVELRGFWPSYTCGKNVSIHIHNRLQPVLERTVHQM